MNVSYVRECIRKCKSTHPIHNWCVEYSEWVWPGSSSSKYIFIWTAHLLWSFIFIGCEKFTLVCAKVVIFSAHQGIHVMNLTRYKIESTEPCTLGLDGFVVYTVATELDRFGVYKWCKPKIRKIHLLVVHWNLKSSLQSLWLMFQSTWDSSQDPCDTPCRG